MEEYFRKMGADVQLNILFVLNTLSAKDLIKKDVISCPNTIDHVGLNKSVGLYAHRKSAYKPLSN